MLKPLVLATSLLLCTGIALADTFGSGANAFTIDFVTINNAGNGHDNGAGGGVFSSTDYGGVDYDFRMATYEISQDIINKATNLGLANVTAGAHTGNQPAADITWYEAAALVNFLNTSKGYQAAYDLIYSGGWSMSLWDVSDQATTGAFTGTNGYRHKDAYYFLPSEDEWYKAAFHQNDGVTANYWDYATGSNTLPVAVASGTSANTAVYGGQTNPADVNLAGGLSAYGAMGMSGNIWELIESSEDGANDSPTKNRLVRGGAFDNTTLSINSEAFVAFLPDSDADFVGFRVASVPEPGTTALFICSVALLVAMRRRSNR
ncbi:formylglycine-generating enzyme family protein [Rubellicoccus peritrichatus]|uniref:SUMF1/EgtB/PvdO family nonheme iron enzyme n=1 Tax=Rubellicoccus peritrichatus TaxID=3080537 RepID=A0AAQ3LCR7_9BACT|nr:SUMF1/EgtB/PvdO family nonheme iron enzyme [Puniceicoccus sp. CR14]WOO41500.1 SUMF1/EgtB/PvdO family nonheme iron enzyme [Puniceicoccus sp. CR14]